MGNYQPFLQGPLPVANYTRIIIPGRFWTRPPSTKSTRMASSATPLHDSLIELAIPDAHAHAIKWYLKFISGPGAIGREVSGADYFSPYTSLVFPVSGLYCDSYRVTKYSGSPAATLLWDTSWYILNNLPTLSSLYNFSIPAGEDQGTIVLEPGEFYQWSFILHAGSRYDISSCVMRGNDAAELWVIKGKAQFREWVAKKQCSTCTRYDLATAL